MFAPLGFVRGLTDEQIAATAHPQRARTAGLPTLEDAVTTGSWLCGPPELITEKIFSQITGKAALSLLIHYPTPGQIAKESI